MIRTRHLVAGMGVLAAVLLCWVVASGSLKTLRPVFSLIPETQQGFPGPPVRVLIADHKEEIFLTARGEYVLYGLPGDRVLKTGQDIKKEPIRATRNGFGFGKSEWVTRGLRIESRGGGDLEIDGSRFRGSLEVHRHKDGRSFFVVNRLGVELYLYGVLPHEMSWWWPMQALRAQAVASRTYALFQAGIRKHYPYDLKSSTFSQLYKGSGGEAFRTKRAVDQTTGEILAYEGKIFPSYFHSTCGGVTASAREFWNIDLPPLQGGVACPYSVLSRHHRWALKLSFAEIEEHLDKKNRSVGYLLSAEPISRTPSGRIGRLRFTGTKGSAVIAAKDFRVWIAGGRIRSTAFLLKNGEDFVELEGRGWGHGVGLCQWGAFGQAFLNRSYEQILEFYYPGAGRQRYAP